MYTIIMSMFQIYFRDSTLIGKLGEHLKMKEFAAEPRPGEQPGAKVESCPPGRDSIEERNVGKLSTDLPPDLVWTKLKSDGRLWK